MLSLVDSSILMMMMTMMMINVETTDIISVQSGDAIVLHSNLTEVDLQLIKDVRWTHLHLVVSLKSNVTMCPHGRCELLTDGSLRFNCVSAEDAGTYRLQAFDKHGKRVMTKDFLLQVDRVASSSVLVHTLTWVILILFVFSLIIFVIVRRRHRSMSPGTLMDNIYVTMHSHQDEKRREEESVPHSAAGFVEASVTQQEEDIYV